MLMSCCRVPIRGVALPGTDTSHSGSRYVELAATGIEVLRPLWSHTAFELGDRGLMAYYSSSMKYTSFKLRDSGLMA